jgi:hypothetical protein
MSISTQPKPDEPKPTCWRRRLLLVLALMAWMLLLGGISYCLFLPNLEEMARERRAILDDPNLTWEQKREKIREMDTKLTSSQGRQVFDIDFKKMHHARNAEMHKFLQMSPEEQKAYVKKQEEERKQFRKQGGFVAGGGPVGGAGGKAGGGPVAIGPGGKPGGGPIRIGASGPGGRGVIFMGPGGGGTGGKIPDPKQMQKTMLDNLSPETRAGMSYQRGLSRSR